MSEHTVIAARPPQDGQDWDCQCARCGSSCDRQDCYNCEEGFSHHDCGEDCCCCLYPEPNVVCDVCQGYCGWWSCLSSPEWCEANPLPGREDISRGKIEWYPTKEYER